jgi:histidyl-tRNA synthetase
LDAFRLSYQVDPRLVRGLDYYTNTVFEIVSEGLGAQNAICGGGAYEGLVEELGGPPTYGVGFAIGEDRLVEVLPAESPARRGAHGPVLVAAIGEAGERVEGGVRVVTRIVEDLRREGVPAIEGGARGGKLFELAEKLGAPAIVFVGEDELAEGTLSIRDVATREQTKLPRQDATAKLRQYFP